MTPIKMLQSADADKYADMLRTTARVNQLYCHRHNIEYASFIGIKRGFYPWHACFNRIMLLNELIDHGYRGWIFYLDADAFVFDLDYDVRKLVSNEFAMVAAPGGLTGQKWDINDGVFLINVGSGGGARNRRALAQKLYGHLRTAAPYGTGMARRSKRSTAPSSHSSREFPVSRGHQTCAARVA
jgi:hypothetical protein